MTFLGLKIRENLEKITKMGQKYIMLSKDIG
jgi:hypothetical protein